MSVTETPENLKPCSICKDYFHPAHLVSCPGCARTDVCEGCFVGFVETDGASGMRCFVCAVPFCRDCGWEGKSTDELYELIALERTEGNLYYNVCPVCHSPNISPLIDDSQKSPTGIPDVFQKVIEEIDFSKI